MLPDLLAKSSATERTNHIGEYGGGGGGGGGGQTHKKKDANHILIPQAIFFSYLYQNGNYFCTDIKKQITCESPMPQSFEMALTSIT